MVYRLISQTLTYEELELTKERNF